MQIAEPIVFSSLEEVNSFPHGWDTEFYALKSGENAFSLERLEGASTVLSRGSFSGPSLQLGSTPKGMKTFAISPNASEKLVWHQNSTDDHSLMVFGDDGELHCTSSAAVSICTVSITLDELDKLASRAGLEPPRGSARQVSMNESDLESFYQDYLLLARLLSKDHSSVRDFERRRATLEEQLQLSLLGAAGKYSANIALNTARSYRTVRSSIDYIVGHLREPIRITAMSQYIGVSVRTLELCFKKHLGVPPKRVINLLRLSAARRELLLSIPKESSVTAVADHWGYWHLGQFSTDYRLAFGESPSASLQRKSEQRI